MKKNPSTLVECPKCGWVHFTVSERYVRNWEKEWAKVWPTLSDSGRAAYGLPDGPPSRDGYLRCFRCGNSDLGTFFETKKVLQGHTVQPILLEGDTGPFRMLSKTEKIVANFLAEGTPNQVIADHLGISIKTVQTHCCSIYRKLGVKNRHLFILRYNPIISEKEQRKAL